MDTLVGALFGHGVADDLPGALEHLGAVGGELHGEDLHALVLAFEALHGGLVAEDGGSRAVGGGAALQLGEHSVDLRAVLDLLQRVALPELRVGVVEAVLVVLGRDLREMLHLRPVHLHVLQARVSEHHRREGLGHALGGAELDGSLHELLQRVGAVGELQAQRAALHLLEAGCQHAAVDASRDQVLGQVDGR
jgi:hypothetical protein